jgi:hypothetical protein
MTSSEWVAISGVLRESRTFHEAVDPFPKILSDVAQPYDSIVSMPYDLYEDVGMYVDGHRLATLYTSYRLFSLMKTKEYHGISSCSVLLTITSSGPTSTLSLTAQRFELIIARSTRSNQHKCQLTNRSTGTADERGI